MCLIIAFYFHLISLVKKIAFSPDPFERLSSVFAVLVRVDICADNAKRDRSQVLAVGDSHRATARTADLGRKGVGERFGLGVYISRMNAVNK